MAWFVYVLQCHNDELYTGVTTRLERRLQEHQCGEGGKFTRTFRPVELIYTEHSSTEHEAKRREVQLKGWSRRKKLALIEQRSSIAP